MMASGHRQTDSETYVTSTTDKVKRGKHSFKGRTDTISKEIRDKQNTLNGLNSKKSSILSRLGEIKSSISLKSEDKKKLDGELQRSHQEISKKNEVVTQIKRTVQYSRSDSLLEVKNRLQKSLDNNNFNCREETKIVNEISKLNKNQRQLTQLDEAKKTLTEETAKCNFIKKNSKENMEQTSQLFKERHKLQTDLNDLKQTIDKLRSELSLLRQTESTNDLNMNSQQRDVVPFPSSKSTPNLFANTNVCTPQEYPSHNNNYPDKQDADQHSVQKTYYIDTPTALSQQSTVTASPQFQMKESATNDEVVLATNQVENEKAELFDEQNLANVSKIDFLLASLQSLPVRKGGSTSMGDQQRLSSQGSTSSQHSSVNVVRRASSGPGKRVSPFRGRINFPAGVFATLIDLRLDIPDSWENLQITITQLEEMKRSLLSCPSYLRTNSASTAGDSAFCEMTTDYTSRPDSPSCPLSVTHSLVPTLVLPEDASFQTEWTLEPSSIAVDSGWGPPSSLVSIDKSL